MDILKLDISYANISDKDLECSKIKTLEAHRKLFEKKGEGNDFLGWLDYYKHLKPEIIKDIENTAEIIREKADFFIVLGIGGSYIGAKSFIDALSPVFKTEKSKPEILFLGQHMDGGYVEELLSTLKGKSVYVNVISKSGTTTETAVSFRVVRSFLKKEYGDNYYKRIIGTTDASRGVLKKYCDEKEIKTYVIPDDIGGRYSVFTPVGLLPLSVAGFDIKKISDSYKDSIEYFKSDLSYDNPVLKYSAIRNIYYEKGLNVEVLINYISKLNPLAEWWKQLFGESEGKDKKGIFPASMTFTTDLHSLGQYLQDGQRILFETVMEIEENSSNLTVPYESEDVDGLKYLEGKSFSEINKIALKATLMAHNDGGVPCLWLKLKKLDEYCLTYLYVFFMVSCGISAYILGVNPFNQPGVEFYKKNMFKLLGKKGY